MQDFRRARLLAGAASFLVYLLPLIGPHALDLLGPHLLREVTSSRDIESSWIFTDFGFAFALQIAAFFLFHWMFRKPGWQPGLLLLAAAPASFMLVESAYLVYIPSIFLIENDTAPETGAWAVQCSVPDSEIVSIRTPERESGSSIPQVLVQNSRGEYAILRIPGCEMSSLPLEYPIVHPGGRVDFTVGLTYMVPSAGILFYRQETANGIMRWNYLRNGSTSPIPLNISSLGPILSNDGNWIGWIERIADSGPPQSSRIMIQNVADADRKSQIDLAKLGPASYVLMEFDMDKMVIVLSRDDRQLVLNLDGVVVASRPAPEGVVGQSSTYRKIDEGWIAWDAYRESGAYRLAWSLAAGSGTHSVLKGRSIVSADADPAGERIALSVSSTLNIGNTQDAIYVLRARDGAEIFRRYLPRYNRSPVLFPSDDLLMYSSLGTTYLVRVPR